MLVAPPSVDREAARRKMQALHGLAEHRIGKAAVDAELDDHTRPQRADDPEAERRMLEPGRAADQVRHPIGGLRDKCISMDGRDLAHLNVHCCPRAPPYYTRYATPPQGSECTPTSLTWG